MLSCDTNNDVQTKEGLLTNSLVQFFKIPKNRDIIVPILTESVPISLRILDYFITNYSKDNTKIIVNDPLLRDFNVYSSYKSQLKAYNKKLFDPFCRLHNQSKIKKFKFHYDDQGNYIVTTTGQLNFFKWAIENKIIDYVVAHYEEIKTDLKQKESQKKERLTSSSTMSDSTTNNYSSHTSEKSSENNNIESLWTNKKVYVISFS